MAYAARAIAENGGIHLKDYEADIVPSAARLCRLTSRTMPDSNADLARLRAIEIVACIIDRHVNDSLTKAGDALRRWKGFAAK